MSGYHQDDGVFELTATKASYWMRRDKLPPECDGKTGMGVYAALLRLHDHEVTKLATNYLHVRATPGQVWEALSGQPSDPERERNHLSRSQPKPVRAAKPAGVHLLPAEAIVLFRAGTDGSGRPITTAVASGRAACRLCGKLIDKGLECVQGGWDFSAGKGGIRPTICYVHTECLTPPDSPASK